MRVASVRLARIWKRVKRGSSGWLGRIRFSTSSRSAAGNGRIIRITIRPRRRWTAIGRTGIQSRFGFHQKTGWGLAKSLKWQTRFTERNYTGGETMATLFDQTENDAAKENALKMLKDDGARLFDLGYNEAKRKAEQEQKARGETTTWDEASEGDKRKYKEDFHCTDELAYWCRKCKKPLSGHWAIVQWWNFCPWCGRKLIREVQNG